MDGLYNMYTGTGLFVARGLCIRSIETAGGNGENRDDDGGRTLTARPLNRALFRLDHALTGAVSAGLLVAILSYARWGYPFVTDLDDRVGEVVAARAVALAGAGHYEEADKTFRKALAQDFDMEPMQRIWTLQRYARMLLEENKAAAAADVMETAFRLGVSNGPSYTLLFESLRKTGKHDRAIEVSRIYARAAHAAGNRDGEKWALYNEGTIYRDRNQFDGAAVAFEKSYGVSPSQENAWQAASALHKLGRDTDALPYLDYAGAHGDSTYAALAETLRNEIRRTK